MSREELTTFVMMTSSPQSSNSYKLNWLMHAPIMGQTLSTCVAVLMRRRLQTADTWHGYYRALIPNVRHRYEGNIPEDCFGQFCTTCTSWGMHAQGWLLRSRGALSALLLNACRANVKRTSPKLHVIISKDQVAGILQQEKLYVRAYCGKF